MLFTYSILFQVEFTTAAGLLFVVCTLQWFLLVHWFVSAFLRNMVKNGYMIKSRSKNRNEDKVGKRPGNLILMKQIVNDT